MAPSKFRVIIIGAGPVGLYLAHALALAGVDFVVLERRTTVGGLNGGSLIFLWPQSVRLLDQIGVWDRVKESALELHEKKRIFGGDGSVLTSSRLFDTMHENHGYPFLPILRSELVRGLYQGLGNFINFVRTGIDITDIKTAIDGVTVHLGDGSMESGSVVVGADGVHSMTRRILQQLAGPQPVRESKEALVFADENPMLASFYGFVGRTTINPGIEKAIFFESRGGGAVIQCTAENGMAHFATISPLAEPTTAKRRYSPSEMEEHAESLGHIFVSPGVQFKDIWARADKTATVMIHQEEGFLDIPWHHGRIVLAGDAVHKTTSVNGLGLTIGLHSAVALANELHGLAISNSGGNMQALDEAFERYRAVRIGEAKTIWTNGFSTIRETTQKGWVPWLWDKFVLPWIDTEKVARAMFISWMFVRHGQILSYVPFAGERGTISWTRAALCAET
ncbi:FAD/NAD(P)-binding domain-containing protein [Paramyrothecium foliicola]|nr:FAD/NAD(P)-binding domain-containing protein [Paramyrothecium foliicola]